MRTKFVKINATHLQAVTEFLRESFFRRGLEPLATMLSEPDDEYTDTPEQIRLGCGAYIESGHSWMV